MIDWILISMISEMMVYWKIKIYYKSKVSFKNTDSFMQKQLRIWVRATEQNRRRSLLLNWDIKKTFLLQQFWNSEGLALSCERVRPILIWQELGHEQKLEVLMTGNK